MFAGYNPFGPANNHRQHLTLLTIFSWTRNRHSLKFGFYASAYRDAMIYGYYLNGEYTSGLVRANRLGQRTAPTPDGSARRVQQYPTRRPISARILSPATRRTRSS